MHEPLRLLAVIQAPRDRIEAIIGRHQVLVDLIGGQWVTVAARSREDEQWSVRSPAGTWAPWAPADDTVDYTSASLEVR
jgi:uncharacterized protein